MGDLWRESNAMSNEMELQADENNLEPRSRTTESGWDPYEVWLTRIRPHQRLGKSPLDALDPGKPVWVRYRLSS
jgi:hypothetical protein